MNQFQQGKVRKLFIDIDGSRNRLVISGQIFSLQYMQAKTCISKFHMAPDQTIVKRYIKETACNPGDIFLHISVPKCSFETNANTFKNVEIKPVSSHFLSREEFRRKLEIKSPIPIAQQSPIDSRVHVNDHPSRFRFVLSTFYLSHVIPLTDDLSSGNLNGSKNH